MGLKPLTAPMRELLENARCPDGHGKGRLRQFLHRKSQSRGRKCNDIPIDRGAFSMRNRRLGRADGCDAAGKLMCGSVRGDILRLRRCRLGRSGLRRRIRNYPFRPPRQR